MWQKARILEDNVFPHLVGKLIWVKAGPPELVNAQYLDGTSVENVPMVEDNLQPINANNDGHGYKLEELELQAEFVEEVEKVPREIWMHPHWLGC